MHAHVRPARAGELAELAELAERTWLAAFGDSVSPDDAAVEAANGRSAERFAAALRERTILVADVAGRLVGYAEFGDVDIAEADASTDDGELHRLYVDAPWQGRGLGGQLLDAALAHPRLAAAPRVFLQVWDENEQALRLYRSRGFRVVGRTAFTIGSEPVEDLVLARERPGRLGP